MSSTDQPQSKGRKPLNARDLRSWKWVPRYFLSIIGSTDAILFLGGGLLVGLLAEIYRRVQTDGSVELFAIAALGLAALAVTLTALSIFVSLVNDTYLRILALNRESGGIAGFVVPYIVSALISALAVVVGTIGAVVYTAVPRWADAVFLGVGAGLALWATWGLFQITLSAAIHGMNRYKVAQDQFEMTDPDISNLLGQSTEAVTSGGGTTPSPPAHGQEGETSQGSGKAEPDTGPGGNSLSLVTRGGLESNLISWIPPLVLVFGLALIIQVYSQRGFNLERGVSALGAKSAGTWIVIILSVLVAGILTRAFELPILHLLEGYWMSFGLLGGLAAFLTRRQVSRLRSLERSYTRYSERAFAAARSAMIASGVDHELVDILETQVIGASGITYTPQKIADAAQIDWRSFARPSALQRMDAIQTRIREYPSPDRILPTRLGNIVRSGEDRVASSKDRQIGDLTLEASIVGERYEPNGLLVSLTGVSGLLAIIFGILAIFGLIVLIQFPADLAQGVTFVLVNVALTLVSYFAVVNFARVYGVALQVHSRTILSRKDS